MSGDLRSTGRRGRRPSPSESVEGLIDRGAIQGNEPLVHVITDDKLHVISILRRSSGPNLVQTFVWKEERNSCQPFSGFIDIWDKNGSDGYGALTVSPY